MRSGSSSRQAWYSAIAPWKSPPWWSWTARAKCRPASVCWAAMPGQKTHKAAAKSATIRNMVGIAALTSVRGACAERAKCCAHGFPKATVDEIYERNIWPFLQYAVLAQKGPNVALVDLVHGGLGESMLTLRHAHQFRVT